MRVFNNNLLFSRESGVFAITEYARVQRKRSCKSFKYGLKHSRIPGLKNCQDCPKREECGSDERLRRMWFGRIKLESVA